MDGRTRKEEKVSGIRDKRKKTECLPDDAIGTFTNDIQELVVTTNSEIANAGVCDVFHV